MFNSVISDQDDQKFHNASLKTVNFYMKPQNTGGRKVDDWMCSVCDSKDLLASHLLTTDILVSLAMATVFAEPW